MLIDLTTSTVTTSVENEGKNNKIMICGMINNDAKNNCEKQDKSPVRWKDTSVGDTRLRLNDEAKINNKGTVHKPTYAEITREKVSKKLTTHKLF